METFTLILDEELLNLGLVEGKGMGNWNPTDEEATELAKTSCSITKKGKMLLDYGLK